MVEHHNVVHLVTNSALPQLTATSATAYLSNPAFDATTWEVWAALLQGLKLLLIPNAVLLDSSVKWIQSIRYLMSKGVTEFLEIGPGNVLTRLMQQTDHQHTTREGVNI